MQAGVCLCRACSAYVERARLLACRVCMYVCVCAAPVAASEGNGAPDGYLSNFVAALSSSFSPIPPPPQPPPFYF